MVNIRFSKEEVDVLRGSWNNQIQDDEEDLEGNSMNASALFASNTFWLQVYERLLYDHPNLAKVIPSAKHQTTFFASIVCTALNNLENLSAMDDFLGSLGRKHVRLFNIQKEYFEAMGCALVDTLELKFEDAQIVNLWGKLYSYLASSLLAAGAHDPIITEPQNSSPYPYTFNGTPDGSPNLFSTSSGGCPFAAMAAAGGDYTTQLTHSTTSTTISTSSTLRSSLMMPSSSEASLSSTNSSTFAPITQKAVDRIPRSAAPIPATHTHTHTHTHTQESPARRKFRGRFFGALRERMG